MELFYIALLQNFKGLLDGKGGRVDLSLEGDREVEDVLEECRRAHDGFSAFYTVIVQSQIDDLRRLVPVAE